MFFKQINSKIVKNNNNLKSTKEIDIFDGLNVKDYVGFQQRKPAIGIVEIYDKDKNLIERTNNLVVYNGREFIASRVFNIGKYVDWKITHFGIGKGGTANDDPTTKVGPNDNDTSLYDPHVLNSHNSSYLAGGKLKPIDASNIHIEQDSYTDNHYTRVRIELLIDPSQEPDLSTPAKINEAALFYTNNNGEYRIFAHVTFTDKYIEDNEKISITWYILF